MLATVYCIFPIYFMLVQSLKTAQEDVFGNPLIVVNPTLENFAELFEREAEVRGFVGRVLRRSYPFTTWLENTLVVFAGSVALTLAVSLAAAYALGRLRPPGFRWWRRIIFATYVIPQTILFVPLYRVVNGFGLDDNLLALLLIYPTMALPFCVWMLSAYFQQLPREIEEAALIEGASRVTAFFRIILPMSRPVLVAAGIFTLGTIASDFMIASIFLLSAHNQTIPAGLGTVEVALDELMAVAGINLMAIPVVLICAAFARGYVRGLSAAMVEGVLVRAPIRAHLLRWRVARALNVQRVRLGLPRLRRRLAAGPFSPLGRRAAAVGRFASKQPTRASDRPCSLPAMVASETPPGGEKGPAARRRRRRGSARRTLSYVEGLPRRAARAPTKQMGPYRRPAEMRRMRWRAVSAT